MARNGKAIHVTWSERLDAPHKGEKKAALKNGSGFLFVKNGAEFLLEWGWTERESWIMIDTCRKIVF